VCACVSIYVSIHIYMEACQLKVRVLSSHRPPAMSGQHMTHINMRMCVCVRVWVGVGVQVCVCVRVNIYIHIYMGAR